jgi:ferredoxin--NADP+ reductase
VTRPLQIAVVGAGPAGLYTIGDLLERLDEKVSIDLYERLATPWGLIRAGVAPDHPEKKSIAPNLFNAYLEHPNVRFIGNVEIGKDVAHEELAQRYDGVIYAVGARLDSKLGIPGEALSGSWPAREFVAWYNGHPDFAHLNFDLSVERAVILGNGNVALDVARILALPTSELRKSDIADHALLALENSKIREIVILGRRGAENAAYNTPELEELEYHDNVSVSVEGQTLDIENQSALANLDWVTRRKQKTLAKLVSRKIKNPDKRIIFRFLTSPKELLGEDAVEKIRVVQNTLLTDASGKVTVLENGKETIFEVGLVLRAIGYRGGVLPGLPFDEQRGVIENQNGRVRDNGNIVPGVYVTGWIKRGPRGIIGSNKKCARETVGLFLEDAEANRLTTADKNCGDILAVLAARNVKVVDLNGWRAIDFAEKSAGDTQNRPRVKITQTEKLLQAAEQKTHKITIGKSLN